ncbi:MAG: hypothetical protein C0399_10100 [Syntrophus sp. (in: bacteria)]|nr:hypothetical protein [Syntrophus sp. (in: bacteria)]
MAPETDNDQGSFQGGADVKVISSLIHAMSMAASKLIAYPDGHPFVLESFQRVENILRGIFESQDQLTFKIAKNTVILGSTVLDQKNPIFQHFAQVLFEHGIIGLILQKGLVLKELMDFDFIISQKRNDIYQQGGINALLSNANIRHIQTRLIDYGLFRTQEGLNKGEQGMEDLQAPLFWESFVKGLFEGTLDPHGKSGTSWIDIDPETLAMMLNDKYLSHGPNAQEGVGFVFKAGMENLDLGQLTGNEELTKRLFKFIRSLNNDLRQSFIETFFNSLPDDSGAAGNILSGLPDEIILDALERHTNQGLYIPPNILRVSQRLAKASTNLNHEEVEKLLCNYSRDELVDKLNIIFKEDEADRFIPEDYQKVLRGVIIAENISAPELSEVPQLEKTLTDQSIDTSLTAIIVDIIVAYDDSEAIPDVLMQSLKDRCSSLIRGGNFHTVLNILETISKKTAYSQNNKEKPSKNLIEHFSDKSFTYEVLESSKQWGKEKHLYITKLIMLIGPPSIEPLLDRLAEEETRALRLYYLELLKGLGVTVKDPAIRRLGDRRWYFIRNLLVILRHLNDPSILDSIHGLFDHSHTRVKQELLHTLLALGDPKAYRGLLNEMSSSDTDRCLKAIMLAGMTQNSEVTQKLVGFLKKRGLGKTSLEIKKAAVHALADIGNPSVLPVLQDVLKSFSLFLRRKSHLLKLEIVESLVKYPAGEVSSILNDIAHGRSAILAKRALLIMKTLKADKA